MFHPPSHDNNNGSVKPQDTCPNTQSLTSDCLERPPILHTQILESSNKIEILRTRLVKLKTLRSDYVRRTHVHCTVLIPIPTSASLTLSLNSAIHLLQDHGLKHFPEATSLDQLFSQDASGAIIVSVDCKPIFRPWDGATQTAHQLMRVHQLSWHFVLVVFGLCSLIIYDVPLPDRHKKIRNLTRHLNSV